MKKMLNVLVVLVLGVLVVNQVNLIKENNKLKEEKLINAYVECLQENHTQRYYCAKQVSDTSYQTLDKKLEKYGYTYKQVGYDLFVKKVEK
jgi:hypothetical protein